MDVPRNYVVENPAINLSFIPQSSGNAAVSSVSHMQPTDVGQEYRKIFQGVIDFADTIRKILVEKGVKWESGRMAEVLGKIQSLPLNSDVEMAQNAQQVSVFILTTFALIADIFKAVVDNSGIVETAVNPEQIRVKTEDMKDELYFLPPQEQVQDDEVDEKCVVTILHSTAMMQTATSPDTSIAGNSVSTKRPSVNRRKMLFPRKGAVKATGKKQISDEKVSLKAPEPKENVNASTEAPSRVIRRRQRGQKNETGEVCRVCGCAPGRRHVMKPHRIKEYVCKTCGEKFPTKAERKNHRLTSHRVRPRPKKVQRKLCSICGASLSKGSALKTHMLRHADVRNYPCSTCGKAFHDARGLSRHREIHNEHGGYMCPTCGKVIATRYNLNRHVKVCGSGVSATSFECDICHLLLPNKKELTAHMNSHQAFHSREKHACGVCGKEYLEQFHLASHMQKVHCRVYKYTYPSDSFGVMYESTHEMPQAI